MAKITKKSFAACIMAIALLCTSIPAFAEGSTHASNESVYVITGADGKVQKTIVSTTGSDSGYSTETVDQMPPVQMSVSYTLDGSPINPNDLAGKAGHVVIRFDYENNKTTLVNIHGTEAEMRMPYLALTFMALDNQKFSNIQVVHGKMVDDGDHTAIIGYALPGMQENLALENDVIDIPDSVEISADTTDFRLLTAMTLVTSELFADESAAQDLKSFVKTESGSAINFENLPEKLNELITGINALADGAAGLENGTAKLLSSAGALNDGVSALSGGLQTIAGSNQDILDGAADVFNTLLQAATSQVNAAGLKVDNLTIENYSTVLNKLLESLSENSVREKARSAVEQTVRANTDTIRSKVSDAAKLKVTQAVLDAANLKMTADEFIAAVSSGKLPQKTEEQISAAVDAKMKSDETAKQIETATEEQIQQMIDQNMKGSLVALQLNVGITAAQKGRESISGLITRLDNFNRFYQGIIAYTKGVSDANDGAKQLLAGTVKLKDGVSQLNQGAAQISEGTAKLSGGVSDLSRYTGGDPVLLAYRIQAMIDMAKNNHSFLHDNSSATGCVRFIYRMESIGE